jgi:hypothetical protein
VVRSAGAELVAVVRLEDLRRLEELETEEDRLDAEEAPTFAANGIFDRRKASVDAFQPLRLA